MRIMIENVSTNEISLSRTVHTEACTMETNGHVNGHSHENGVNGIEVEATHFPVKESEATHFPVIESEATQFPVIESTPPTKKIEIPSAKLGEVKVTDYMKECIDKVALAEGFKNYDANVDHGSGVGDGFVGLMFKATIQEKDSDKKLPIVLKVPPFNLARRNDFGSMRLFQREVYLYNEVLPEFVRFQEEKHIKEDAGFFKFPKCYFAEYNEEKDDAILIMEDLRERDCRMWDKFKPINFEHAKLVFAAIGRLHAVSFAMKVQKPEVFEKFKALTDPMSETMLDDNFVNMMKGSIQRAIDTLDPTDVKRRARVGRLNEDFLQAFKDIMNPKLAEPFAVVTHGDCWSNNFMFQYKRGFPTNVVMLDWQISRYCSPVLDLVYFCFVCSDASMRARHYDELLNIYHRSLKDLLDHLGGDTQSQFPFTALLRQLKQFGKFGIIMSSMLVPMLSTKSEDLPDMDFMAENLKNADPELMEEVMKKFGAPTDANQARMRGNLLDACRYGYL